MLVPMMVWWSLAFAAPDGCAAAHPVAQWEAELVAAREAVESLALGPARAWLAAIEQAAPCLDAPAPRALLRTHAELQAAMQVYDQDPGGIEVWVRQRRELGSERPWSLGPDHPVHRFAAEVEPTETVAVGTARPPKRGGVFVDGRWVAEVELSVGTRHLVQVFDGAGDPVAGTWVTGAVVVESWVGEGEAEEPPRWFSGPGAPSVERPTWRAARRDTLRAYERYLRREPVGEHASEARRRIDALRWARYPHTPDGARAYLADWPDGRHRPDAEAILQEQALDEAIAEGGREALQLFVGRYPDGVYAAEAERRLDGMAFADAVREDTERAYARYLVHWPEGAHVGEARLAQEERAWEAAQPRGRQGLQDYLDAWPDGVWAAEARRRLSSATK